MYLLMYFHSVHHAGSIQQGTHRCFFWFLHFTPFMWPKLSSVFFVGSTVPRHFFLPSVLLQPSCPILSVIRGRISHSKIPHNHLDEEQPFLPFSPHSIHFSFYFLSHFVLSFPFLSSASFSPLLLRLILAPLPRNPSRVPYVPTPFLLVSPSLLFFSFSSFPSSPPALRPAFLSLSHRRSSFSLLCDCLS